MKAVGKLHKLWIAFSKFYEDNDQIDDARTIFEKAAKVQFRSVDDLAAIWCEYAEMELRQENYNGALRLMRRSTTLPGKRYKSKKKLDKNTNFGPKSNFCYFYQTLKFCDQQTQFWLTTENSG